MREILFRGKQVFFNDWIEGTGIFNDGINTWLSFNEPEKAIAYGLNHKRVRTETIGQFTGLTDKNGKKIFEGDIVLLRRKNLTPELFYVIWKNKSARFLLVDKNGVQPCPVDMADVEVVGNIHDNPELLNGGNENE